MYIIVEATFCWGFARDLFWSRAASEGSYERIEGGSEILSRILAARAGNNSRARLFAGKPFLRANNMVSLKEIFHRR